jgi:hypothetical protein
VECNLIPGIQTEHYITTFFKRVWKEHQVPEGWQIAYIVLISKTSNTSSADQFRLIALENTLGKLFFTLVQIRTTEYVLQNKYLDISVQKAFLPKMAGCVEHTQTLISVLCNTHQHQCAITVTFIDLQITYGTVRHSFIAYVLAHYHFPPMILSIVLSYYDLLIAQVVTPNFSSMWIHYSIDLF